MKTLFNSPASVSYGQVETINYTNGDVEVGEQQHNSNKPSRMDLKIVLKSYPAKKREVMEEYVNYEYGLFQA